MKSLVRLIIEILRVAYQSLWICLLLSALTMFLYMYVNGIGFNKNKGLKSAVRIWINEFKTSSAFRRDFIFAFYTYMILYQTLLGREVRENPLEVIFQNWTLIENGQIVLSTTKNIIVFAPFTALLLWTFGEKLLKDRKATTILWQSTKSAFLLSVTIETLQLVLFLGTFQFSDIFFNTVGGVIGGLAFLVAYRIKHMSTWNTGI